MLLRSASLRLVRLASRGRHSGMDPLSAVAAVRAEEASVASSTRRLALTGGAMLCGYWAYGKATNGYAYVQLGAAATEQLFMQGLEGTVELEMTLRPFSSTGELRGSLTPASPTSPWLPRNPPGPWNGTSTQGARSHPSFSLISHPPDQEQQQQREAPVPTVRHVGVLPPVHLSALGGLWSPDLAAACQRLIPVHQYSRLEEETIQFELELVAVKTAREAALFQLQQAVGNNRNLFRLALFLTFLPDILNFLGVTPPGAGAPVSDAAFLRAPELASAAAQHAPVALDAANRWAEGALSLLN